MFPKWLRKKLDGKKFKRLPTLPAERRHVLTPSSSQEALSSSIATTNISFFQRFPFEIRRLILIYAFGDKTVHMDLCFEHPPEPWKPKYQKLHPTHCDINVIYSKFSGDPWVRRLDESKPKQWRWWGSVCHRKRPSAFGGKFGNYPDEDACRDGRGTWCEFWPGEKPGKCFIGVMGWLLTSRQASAEGVDVLYSTNAIHMASLTMIQNLPRLLLPQRLASIRSVELVLDFDPSRNTERHYLPKCDLPTYHSLLKEVPLIFPHLRKLHLSLTGKLKPLDMDYEEFGNASETIVMAPMDDLVCRLGFLQNFDVNLPASTYWHPKEKATGNGGRLTGSFLLERDRFWRELHLTEKENGATSHLQDYWVRLGQIDISEDFIGSTVL